MAEMTIEQVTGANDAVVRIEIHVDAPGAVSMRLGNTLEEVALSEWRPFANVFPWDARGDEEPGPYWVYGEVRFDDGRITSLAAPEPPRIPGRVEYQADDPLDDTFDEGRENWVSYAYRLFRYPDGTFTKADRGNGRRAHSNVFFPYSHSSDGTIWTDDSRWTVDYPEKIDGKPTVLPALTYARWHTNGAYDTISLVNATISVDLFGRELQLYGGTIGFWVTTDRGRWHFPAQLKLGANTFELDATRAKQSWARNLAPLNVEPPDLSKIESWGFAFTHFSAEPSGVFGLDNFKIRYEPR